MDKSEFAFLTLRLSIIEEVFLKDETLKEKYLEKLEFFKFIIEEENQPNSYKILSLITDHIISTKKFKTE